MEGMFTVTFDGDYFSLSTWIHSTSPDQAIDDAATAIQEYYGWDIEAVSKDIRVEKEIN